MATNKKALVTVLCIEAVIVLGLVWRCYALGGCSHGVCVPTGVELAPTCLELGVKSTLALFGPTLIVAWLIRRDGQRT